LRSFSRTMLGPALKLTRPCDQTGKADLNLQRLTPNIKRDDHPVLFDFQGAVDSIIGTLSPQRQTVNLDARPS
jgi:hypothetical protein